MEIEILFTVNPFRKTVSTNGFRLFLFAFAVFGGRSVGCFFQQSKKETFAARFVGEEMVNRQISSRCVAANVPVGIGFKVYDFRSKLVCNEQNVFLVLPAVKGARTIDYVSALSQCRPNGTQYVALALHTIFHISLTPFRTRRFVFAEHAFSRTRDIGGNDVEVFFECAECRGFVAGDYAIGRSPFDNIFGEDMRPVGYDFVADD